MAGQADSTIAPWFATDSVQSAAARAAMAAIWADAPAGVGTESGVVPTGGNINTGFVPTSVGSGSAPAVSCAPGQCVLQRPVGGTYVCTLPVASSNIALTTPLPPAGQTRIDVLCALVVDGEADGAVPPRTNVLRLTLVTGTAAPSPTAPSVPGGYLPLYQVTVSNAGTLNFTDVRIFTRGVGGLRFVQSGDARDGSYPSDLRIFATGQIDAWVNLTGTWSWVTIVAPSVWTQISNVAWTYNGPPSTGVANFGAGGTSIARYKRTGNDLTISYEAVFGTSPAMGSGPLSVALPNGWVTPAGRDQWIPAHLYVNDPVSGFKGDYVGGTFCAGGLGSIRPFFQISNADDRFSPWKVATTPGGSGGGVPLVTGGYPQGGRIHINGTVELAS